MSRRATFDGMTKEERDDRVRALARDILAHGALRGPVADLRRLTPEAVERAEAIIDGLYGPVVEVPAPKTLRSR